MTMNTATWSGWGLPQPVCPPAPEETCVEERQPVPPAQWTTGIDWADTRDPGLAALYNAFRRDDAPPFPRWSAGDPAYRAQAEVTRERRFRYDATFHRDAFEQVPPAPSYEQMLDRYRRMAESVSGLRTEDFRADRFRQIPDPEIRWGDEDATRVAENVQKAVALLDEAEPGWWRADRERPIRLESLRIECPMRCVLGQLFGVYHNGLKALSRNGKWPERSVQLGFLGSHRTTEAWKKVIAERRAAPLLWAGTEGGQ